MKLNNNLAFLIVVFLFALTVIYRNEVEKGKVDLSSYFFDVNNTKEYLLKEKFILFSNQNAKTLLKINYYNSPNGKLYSEDEVVILKEKINPKLISSKKYILKENHKLFVVDKSFYKKDLLKEQK